MKAGISIEKLGLSQVSFELTRELNKLDNLDDYWDIIVFFKDYDKTVLDPKFALLQEKEMWGFDAPCVATSLHTAETLLNCPRPTKKFFYVWDLEWLSGEYDIDFLSHLYMNDALHLIARSQEHFEIINYCWKKPEGIVEGFDYEQLTKILA